MELDLCIVTHFLFCLSKIIISLGNILSLAKYGSSNPEHNGRQRDTESPNVRQKIYVIRQIQ